MKVHFYLDRRKGKAERLQIFMHFWYKGKLLRVFTGEHCNHGEWDQQAERVFASCKGSAEINRLLQSMEEEVLLIVRLARTGRRPVDVDYIRDNLTFLTGRGREFFSVWEEFVMKESVKKEWSPGMVKRFDILKMHLKILHKQQNVGFNNINEKFYKRFIEYHYNQGFHRNYAARNLELLRWFMNWATLQGYNMNLVYKSFKSPEKESLIYEGRFLNAAELQKLYKLDTDDSLMESVKDIFCFGCLTGLRYADLLKLREEHISGDQIIYTRKKPPIKVEIPLVDIALEILNKYRPGKNGRIFPDTSIQIFNKSLKELGKLAGLINPVKIKYNNGNGSNEQTYRKWELLSSRFTRWTFLKLGVEMGIGLEVMSELTGNLPGTLRNYYKPGSDYKDAEMKKLNMLFKI